MGQTINAVVLIVDSLVACACCYPSSTASTKIFELFCDGIVLRNHVTISPVFLCGVAIATVGTWIRMMCYRELGRFFVFDLALRDKHRLIKTGPYSFVRHPSYSGFALVWIGESMCMFGEGSWWVEAGIHGSGVGRLMIYAWAALVAHSFTVVVVMLARREERLLRKAFGKDHVEYTKATPWMLIPGVW